MQVLQKRQKLQMIARYKCKDMYNQGSYTPRGIFFQDIPGGFYPQFPVYFRTILTNRHAAAAEPADQVFQFLKYINKERKKTREIQFYILPL
jgi:hypothetical protein